MEKGVSIFASPQRGREREREREIQRIAWRHAIFLFIYLLVGQLHLVSMTWKQILQQ
jgi:hypothetical protein